MQCKQSKISNFSTSRQSLNIKTMASAVPVTILLLTRFAPAASKGFGLTLPPRKGSEDVVDPDNVFTLEDDQCPLYEKSFPSQRNRIIGGEDARYSFY